MKKIYVAMLAADLGRTGISTVIMNYCRNIDKDLFKIDLLVGNHILPEYREECERFGISIVELPFKLENPKRYYRKLWQALSGDKYDIVHIHGNSAMITPELIIARLKRIKVRIAHSHNTTCNHLLLNQILKPVFNLMYTEGFSCSRDAGQWMFGNKKFYIIPNGFNIEHFKFVQENRDEIRGSLNLVGKYVIGHIGQFNSQKNHKFLLAVFEKVAEKKEDAYLILVGNGPDFKEICQIIEKHPFKEKIILYGETDYPEKIYSAMDVFAFPSKHEGLGIVLLEAQVSGLPCVVSDVIPKEAIISNNVIRMSLEDKVEKWAENMIEPYSINRAAFYDDKFDLIQKYNIRDNTRLLEKYYRIFLEESMNGKE